MAIKNIDGYIELHNFNAEVQNLVLALPVKCKETFDGVESYEFYGKFFRMDSGELAAKLNEIHEVATRTGVEVTAEIRCLPVFTEEVFVIDGNQMTHTR